MAAPATLQEFGALVVRSKLMTADELKGALKGLRSTGSEAGDLEAARRLLVGNKHLTEYQAALLVRGHADGFVLAGYRVLDRVGKGRMAGVYKAADEAGQLVAIKVLPASRARDPETVARFWREAKLHARLVHPNVVRAIAVGEADGRPYLVQEYLSGETLEEVLAKRKRLPPAEAVRIVHQALLGLQHLHEKGMIHRDLKPANLMLVDPPDKTVDPAADRAVKILDIGLGKAMFEDADPAQKITGEGVLIGTPDYLAPEQAKNAKGADIRADIYSAGCVLYHALTGQPPFPDKSILNQVMRHATEPPRPLSDFLKDVPEGLQTAMNWLLAKDPAQRYPAPERAAQALSLFLPKPPAAKSAAAPVYPEAVKVVEPAPPPAIPIGMLESPGRKSSPIPPPTIREPAIDVELVPVPAPPRTREERGWLELNRRDAVMLIAGGLLVSLALLAGWGLYRVLRPAPPGDTPVENPSAAPGPGQVIPGHPHKPGDPLEG